MIFEVGSIYPDRETGIWNFNCDIRVFTYTESGRTLHPWHNQHSKYEEAPITITTHRRSQSFFITSLVSEVGTLWE
jgi:hypothetical protein